MAARRWKATAAIARNPREMRMVEQELYAAVVAFETWRRLRPVRPRPRTSSASPRSDK